MKIRNGFVSNSSSSSFIIAFKTGDSCETCGHKGIDILKVIEDISEENTRIYGTGLEAISKILNEDYDPPRKDTLKKAEELDKKGYTLINVGIGYELCSLFSALIKASPNVVVLLSEN